MNKERKPVCGFFEYDARQSVFCANCRRHKDLHLEGEEKPENFETTAAVVDPLENFKEPIPAHYTGKPLPFATARTISNEPPNYRQRHKLPIRF